MLGDTYTIVDMALWGWARLAPYVIGEDEWAKFRTSSATPMKSPRAPPPRAPFALKDKHKFKAEMDDEARRNMFRHLTVGGGLTPSAIKQKARGIDPRPFFPSE